MELTLKRIFGSSNTISAFLVRHAVEVEKENSYSIGFTQLSDGIMEQSNTFFILNPVVGCAIAQDWRTPSQGVGSPTGGY